MLTGSQKHELAKIADGGGVIVEQPSPWNDTLNIVPTGSIVITYKVGNYRPNPTYVELIIEPNGTRHYVR
jgi:hypothetical protein